MVETLENRFWENDGKAKLFGENEASRTERAQIVYALNELALEHCGVSFNELCQGVQPTKRPGPAR